MIVSRPVYSSAGLGYICVVELHNSDPQLPLTTHVDMDFHIEYVDLHSENNYNASQMFGGLLGFGLRKSVNARSILLAEFSFGIPLHS